MQNDTTPTIIASQNGHTETVALLLANKADINAANKVRQFKIFKYLQLIDNDLQDINISFFILSTIIAHKNMNYYSTWLTLVLYADRYYPSVYSFPKGTH
jgi:ankyrin repeat protein